VDDDDPIATETHNASLRAVVHDLNNVLTVIQSYAALLQQSLPADTAERCDADVIVDAAKRAEQLTERLISELRWQRP
jgi:signal transduction histidine kinase